MSLLEMFIHGEGGSQLRTLVAQQPFLEDEPCLIWDVGLMNTSVALMQLVWPMTMSFSFPESLLVDCQFSQLQNYVRLAQEWCTDWNLSSRKFVLAYSYLNTM